MATYAVVHGTQSAMIRRVIADDDGLVEIGMMPDGVTPAVICNHSGDQPASYHPLADGESAIVVFSPDDVVHNPQDWSDAVEQATGIVPPNLTCALIDANNVVRHVIHADPAIDSSPSDLMMVACPSAVMIGYTYDPATGKFWTVGGTLNPGDPGNPTDQPITVPPQEV